MKTTKLKQSNATKSRSWFQRRHRWHDPVLVFNMSIFNSPKGRERIFDSLPQRENVCYEKTLVELCLLVISSQERYSFTGGERRIKLAV